MEEPATGPLPGLDNFSFAVLLGLVFCSLLPIAFGRPATRFLRHGVALCDNGLCLLDRDFRSIHITQLIGLVLTEHDQHPVEQMRGTGTDGLFVMFPLVDQLIVVDRRHLRVPAPGDLGIQIGELAFPNQGRLV